MLEDLPRQYEIEPSSQLRHRVRDVTYYHLVICVWAGRDELAGRDVKPDVDGARGPVPWRQRRRATSAYVENCNARA